MALPKVLRITHSTDNTTIVNNDQIVTVKDIAIDGILADLASARGIFDTLTKGSVDCNTLTEQGVYAIALSGSVNGPGFSAKLIVFNGKNSKFVNQMALATGAGTSGAIRVAYRSKKNNEDVWSSWSEGILSGRIGDGLTVSNGIISVPEYSGATASTAGTSGLVPPATAGQQESFLTGGGEYKPALTKISDSVSLEDSTTAASAKAVKTAYDLASAALPKSGGTISGNISVVGGITVAAPDGKSEGGGQILLKNGTDGSYPVVIDTTQNQIRFLSGPGGPTLEEVKTAKLSEINAAADRAIGTLTATYPDQEISTFDKQESKARAYVADPTASTPLLSPSPWRPTPSSASVRF